MTILFTIDTTTTTAICMALSNIFICISRPEKTYKKYFISSSKIIVHEKFKNFQRHAPCRKHHPGGNFQPINP